MKVAIKTPSIKLRTSADTAASPNLSYHNLSAPVGGRNEIRVGTVLISAITTKSTHNAALNKEINRITCYGEFFHGTCELTSYVRRYDPTCSS